MLEFAFDLNHAQILWKETRMTVSGIERTLFAYIPSPGCSTGRCPFCSLKHLRAEGYVPTAKKASEFAEKIACFVSVGSIDTLKIFLAGNSLRDTELHPDFWRLLPGLLPASLKALELEVRVDDLATNFTQAKVLQIKQALEEKAINLRLILAYEYASPVVLDRTGKYTAFRHDIKKAVSFLQVYKIEYLVYAMFGGRLGDRAMTANEAVESAAATIDFAFELDWEPREVIVNCQYLDPVQQDMERQSTHQLLYVPSGADIIRLLNKVRPLLLEGKRVRISYAPEETILGTTGPDLTNGFKSKLDNFNRALDQSGRLP